MLPIPIPHFNFDLHPRLTPYLGLMNDVFINYLESGDINYPPNMSFEQYDLNPIKEPYGIGV
jgi:hypothetical protein